VKNIIIAANIAGGIKNINSIGIAPVYQSGAWR
jgi:hypothetical protein